MKRSDLPWGGEKKKKDAGEEIIVNREIVKAARKDLLDMMVDGESFDIESEGTRYRCHRLPKRKMMRPELNRVDMTFVYQELEVSECIVIRRLGKKD